MSELTRCNYCSYKSIQAHHGEENVSFHEGIGEWRGWVVVEVKGKTEPVAYFKQLTAHCVC